MCGVAAHGGSCEGRSVMGGDVDGVGVQGGGGA